MSKKVFEFTVEELERVLGNALDLYEEERKEYATAPAPARALVIDGIRDSLIEWGGMPLFPKSNQAGRHRQDK